MTSPAGCCAQPTAETVRRVPLPARASAALARLDGGPRPGPRPCVALTLAPEWADAHHDEPAPRPGPEWLRELVEGLRATALPPARPGPPACASAPG